MAETVHLIDPIESVSNLPNGTPTYEDMFIFAELLGQRRERSVIDLTTSDNKTTLSTEFTNANINMLGVNFSEGLKNENINFTTNWTDNEANVTTPLEGFGITKIDVNIDSSYMPKVNIEFVDIRGASFYNLGDKSPYSLLFDFPPPIFKMTLKGYYGKSLDYDLHLVKHNTRFDSETGNYYINVDFVARTFAPLADIPFKYVELVSLMSRQTAEAPDQKSQESANQDINNSVNQNLLNTNSKVPPRNIRELIQKLKRLYIELKNLKNTSREAEDFENAKNRLTEGRDIIRYMNSFSSEIGTIYENNSRIIIQNNNNDSNNKSKADTGDFRIVNGVSVYDDTIKASDTSGNNSNSEKIKLFLGTLNKKIRDGNVVNDNDVNTTNLNEKLTQYKNKLEQRGISFSDNNIKSGIIPEPKTIRNYNPEDLTNKSQNNYDEYQALDVTKFYIELNKIITSKIDEVDEAQKALVEVINNRAEEVVGFLPTIYNIFKILCDDIDLFFRELGRVSNNAEIHHNKYFNDIITNNDIRENKSRNVTKKLYPFPLFTETSVSNCGITRKVRKIPREDLVENEIFPEIRFINQFIDTLILQRKTERIDDMRTQVDSNGNNKWIPVTPADSILSEGVGYDSPYANLENLQGSDNIINSIYTKLLNRFYIASQFSFGKSFYSINRNSKFLGFGNRELKRIDLIKYIAESEAVNLSSSIINDDVLESLRDKADDFKVNPNLFYDEISSLPSYSSIPDDVLRLSDGNKSFYKRRENENYIGFEIIKDSVSLRINGDGNTPIDNFINNTDTNFFVKLILPNNENAIKNFTTENIPYFSDSDSDNNSIFQTKFINGLRINDRWFSNDSIGAFDANTYTDYASTLSAIFASGLDNVKDFINGSSTRKAKAFILASLFGRARSYFSDLGDLNTNFLNPSAIEVPRFSLYYMGGIVEYNNDSTFKAEIDDLIENEVVVNFFGIGGQYIRDDASKSLKLSDNDAANFSREFNIWRESEFDGLVNDYIRLINDIENSDIDPEEDELNDRAEKIESLIKESNFRSIEGILEKEVILNYSEFTFSNENFNLTDSYDPLSVTRNETIGGEVSKSNANDDFFKAFWRKLAQTLPEQKEELDKVEEDITSVVTDEDIKTQLYYSFKNISDKWISGINTVKRGFPLNNGEGDSLISKFAFVDRAMNPIGNEAIINTEALVEMSKDYDLNMFQVFSRLLSLNGFEFFPLQNFMSFERGEWENTFRTFTTLEQQSSPAFVCMYLGGTSSMLENSPSSFDNDGILDLREEGLPDFNVNTNCNDSEEVNDSSNRQIQAGEGRFKYSEPKAFRVRFGEQNQSFFTNIQIEGRDFPETADSLAILSKIAGDGKTSPVPKGQNLFSTYENRAYSVTVTMLGNVMIQPTQYFQLENIPMYSGAYMITEVNHSVEPNHMLTTFKGVKVLKFPNPFVRDFATSIGIESGTTEDRSGNVSVTTNNNLIINQTVSARTLQDKNSGIYNNEQFKLKISP